MPKATFDTSAVKFDLSNLKARDMHAFMKAAQVSDFETVASIFSRSIVAGPWDALDNPDTYLELPYDVWKLVFKAFTEEVAGKN